MTINITAKEILELLEYAAPDREKDPEQLETQMTLWTAKEPYKDAETGEERPAGIYAYFSEYPEEGSVFICKG